MQLLALVPLVPAALALVLLVLALPGLVPALTVAAVVATYLPSGWRIDHAWEWRVFPQSAARTWFACPRTHCAGYHPVSSWAGRQAMRVECAWTHAQ